MFTLQIKYIKVWAALVCERGGIEFTHLCARWANKALPQCAHSWMCTRTHVWVLWFCLCSVPMKAGWKCVQLCAQPLSQMAFP